MFTYEITVNGQVLTQQVSSITITKSLHEESLGVIALFANPSEIATAFNFNFGDAIDISLGYDQNRIMVFSGVIAHFVLTFDTQGSSYNLICNELPSDLPVEENLVMALKVGENILEAHTEVIAENEVHGNFHVEGNNQLIPGAAFSVGGFGTLVDRNYTIQKIVHDVEDGNWLSTIYF